MPGFFPEVRAKTVLHVLPQCGLCKLYKGCRTPKMKVSGHGREGILIVGEAPGKDEDRNGEHFVGSSGRRLRAAVTRAGFDAYRDCWMTNALVCHPAGKTPNKRATDWCRPNVVKVIEELKPKVILLLGARAVKSVIGWLWKEDTGGIMRWAGFRCPSQQLNAWICPTYNPAFVLRAEHPVADLFFDDHVRRAVRLSSRPWKKVPDWKNEVRIECNPELVRPKLVDLLKNGDNTVAFDYETTCLKPDNPQGQIYCCAVSSGKDTLSYPWHGDATEATKELILNNRAVRKIGYNCKFEDRWTRDKLGIQIENWKHDGMQVAHCLDNRHQITSLKFQAFARLGMSDYDSHIKPYLQSDTGGNGLNRIKELPLNQVLEYCGLDALLEYRIWQHQLKEMKR